MTLLAWDKFKEKDMSKLKTLGVDQNLVNGEKYNYPNRLMISII